MNYINKGKRDILIVPKLENIEKIQSIRDKYDELAKIIPPHITLAFPFKNDLSNDELKSKLKDLLSSYKPFKIKLEGVTLNKDNRINKYYVFLNITEGKEKINQIHDEIYEKILINDPAVNYSYEPHITLGTTDDEKENIKLNETFETIIDTIFVESIGENEESIIEFEINL